MRLSLEWLRDALPLPAAATPDEIADTLVRIGFEVEDVHTVPPTTGSLVVGRVLAVEELTGLRKPIRFCQVDVGPGNGPDGSDDPRGIICGATNFAEGDAVVVALPGTVLPGGFQIASRMTYQHLSDGMICSNRELGIGHEHDGILVIASGDEPGAVPGSDARRIIGADDVVIELAITPDRGYALSIRGLARELAAAYDLPFTDPGLRPLPERSAGGWPVTIADPVGCGRFATVRVEGIDPTAPSPYWIRRRLTASGIRSISLAVDVTNYVMVELGQPLHAFDADKLTGSVTVRRAVEGEILVTLDGSKRTLVADDLVVADESGAISMAGDGWRIDRDLFGDQQCHHRGGLLGSAGDHAHGASAPAAERGGPPVRAGRGPGGRRGGDRARRRAAGPVRRRNGGRPVRRLGRPAAVAADRPADDRARAADRPAVRPRGDRPPAAAGRLRRRGRFGRHGRDTADLAPRPDQAGRSGLVGRPAGGVRLDSFPAARCPGRHRADRRPAPGTAGRGRSRVGRADRGALLPVPE